MTLTLRPATLQDWARLYAWRNDPVTRAMFRQGKLVPMATHMDWLRTILESDVDAMFMAESDARPVGTIRLSDSIRRDCAEISLTVAPEQRGHGFARAMIAALLNDLTASGRSGVELIAEIKSVNYPSLRAFASNGFVYQKTIGQYLRLAKVIPKPNGTRLQ